MWNRIRRSGHVQAIGTFAASSALALGGTAVSDVAIQSAEAADDGAMPGIACEVEHEPFATSRANLRFLHDAADDTQVFVCPVARDDTTGELGRIIDELTHYVVLPGDPVCTIHAVPADGTMIELMRSTALSRGLTALHDELPGFVARDRERYVLECHLGPNGRIIGGRWRED